MQYFLRRRPCQLERFWLVEVQDGGIAGFGFLLVRMIFLSGVAAEIENAERPFHAGEVTGDRQVTAGIGEYLLDHVPVGHQYPEGRTQHAAVPIADRRPDRRIGEMRG